MTYVTKDMCIVFSASSKCYNGRGFARKLKDIPIIRVMDKRMNENDKLVKYKPKS